MWPVFVWRDFSENSSFQVGVDVVVVDVGGGEEEEEGCSPISFQVMVTGSVLTRGENWLFVHVVVCEVVMSCTTGAVATVLSDTFVCVDSLSAQGPSEPHA